MHALARPSHSACALGLRGRAARLVSKHGVGQVAHASQIAPSQLLVAQQARAVLAQRHPGEHRLRRLLFLQPPLPLAPLPRRELAHLPGTHGIRIRTRD